MAIKELKYNNTIIYVDDEISEEEMGYALHKKNSLEDTQELDLKENLKLLDDTQEFDFSSLEGESNE